MPPPSFPPYNLPPYNWIQQYYAAYGGSIAPPSAPPPPQSPHYVTLPNGSRYIHDTSNDFYINPSGRRVQLYRDFDEARAARAAYDAQGGAERYEHAAVLENRPRGPNGNHPVMQASWPEAPVSFAAPPRSDSR
ncbi:hypothetical protein B0A48_07634 [Cryoendolithus antarcticus]|uniref:Uncharacterized protein n=1 Tax=Cryoendolithus antarcticus TaxID=1507870 RepID=A0A1V8T756_9PEZI|nr:hypothetical protein B0A48_07634 [Cryoendolithus antarcticus]